MIYLDLEELRVVAERALGGAPEVRDHGLLDSALARPSATAFGEDAYLTIHDKAAALLHSLARNHALVDGNKRLALGHRRLLWHERRAADAHQRRRVCARRGRGQRRARRCAVDRRDARGSH